MRFTLLKLFDNASSVVFDTHTHAHLFIINEHIVGVFLAPLTKDALVVGIFRLKFL